MAALPNELWTHIFSFVKGNKELQSIALTSRRFRELVETALWSAIEISLPPPIQPADGDSSSEVEIRWRKFNQTHTRRLRLSVRYYRDNLFQSYDLSETIKRFANLDHLSIDTSLLPTKIPPFRALASLNLDFERIETTSREDQDPDHPYGHPHFLESGTPADLALWTLDAEQFGWKDMQAVFSLPTMRRLAIQNAGRTLTLGLCALEVPEQSLAITHLTLDAVDVEGQKGVVALIKTIKGLKSLRISLSSRTGNKVQANVIASVNDLPAAILAHRDTLEEIVVVHAPERKGTARAADPLLAWPAMNLPNLKTLYIPAEFAFSASFFRWHLPSMTRLGISTMYHSGMHADVAIEKTATIQVMLTDCMAVPLWRRAKMPSLREIEWWIVPPPMPVQARRTRARASWYNPAKPFSATRARWAQLQVKLPEIRAVLAISGVDFRWTNDTDIDGTGLGSDAERRGWRRFEAHHLPIQISGPSSAAAN